MVSNNLRRVRRAVAVGALFVAAAAGAGGCSHETKQQQAMTPAQREQSIGAQMVALGSEHAEGFLHHSQMQAIRNMLGGARGVFLAPNISGGAAIVGYETGTGFLIRRHGKEWSDPVFYTLSGTSAGWQIGAKEERVLILLMTDAAVDNFIKGNMELGGTGGFAIGTWGMGAAGAGEMK